MTNHALRIIFAPREQQDANEYSDMLGYTAMRKDNVSRSRSRDSSYTRSESEERRALMLPQEIKAIGDDKEILLVEGEAHPVLADKIRYFEDRVFRERLLPRTEVPILVLPALAQVGPTGGKRVSEVTGTAQADGGEPRLAPQFTGLSSVAERR